MFKLNDKGIIQILILLLLLAGLIVGIILIKDPTRFLPKAGFKPSVPETSLTLQLDKTQYQEGDIITANLYARSDIDAANLFSAKLNFPQDKLEVIRYDFQRSAEQYVRNDCLAGSWDQNLCRRCNNEGYWGQPGGDWAELGYTASTGQWCNCARNYDNSNYNDSTYPICFGVYPTGRPDLSFDDPHSYAPHPPIFITTQDYQNHGYDYHDPVLDKIQVGDPVFFRANIKKLGGRYEGSFDTMFCLDSPDVRNCANRPDRWIIQNPTPNIVSSPVNAYSEQRSVEENNSQWIATPGEHTIYVCIDYTNNIPEDNEDNNCSSLSFKVVSVRDYFIKNVIEHKVDNSAGIISLVGGVPNPGIKTNISDESPIMATVTFKVKSGATGDANISFDNSSAIYRNSDNVNILATKRNASVTITNSPTATSSPSPSVVSSASSPVPSVTPSFVPSPSPSPVPVSGNKDGDGNNDGKVDLVDMSMIMTKFNQADNSGIDINRDQIINSFDFSLMINLLRAKMIIEE